MKPLHEQSLKDLLDILGYAEDIEHSEIDKIISEIMLREKNETRTN